MAKTIKIELAKENPQGVGWFYGYVELPAEEHEIRDAYQKARITDNDNAYHDITILDCPRLPELTQIRIDGATIDELNFLAKRLDSLTDEECDKVYHFILSLIRVFLCK